MAIAMVSSVLACVRGTYVSYYFDLSTGGSIVVLLTLIFVAALLFAPQYGILFQW
jgi:manganese transport system permease protein